MTELACQFPGDREQAIVSFLYDDDGSAERAAFEAHMGACERCRREIAALGDVRTSLGAWGPPEPARPFAFEAEREVRPRQTGRVLSALAAVPAWAQVAAALLVLGVAAGIARFDVQYDASGFRVRTGWSSSQAVAPEAAREGDAQWRTELTALEQRLRTELRQPAPQAVAAVANGTSPGSAANASSPETLRRVRAMVDESEQRQQRELALRLAETVRELNTQRQSDLVKIDRSIGAMQNNTGLEILRTRETINNINNYLVRTSSQQRPQ